MKTKFEKNKISSSVFSQVIIAITILTLIFTGTVISITADVAVSKTSNNNSVAVGSDTESTDFDEKNKDSNDLKDNEYELTADLSDFELNSIYDLTEDNHKLLRRDNLNEQGKRIYDSIYNAALKKSEFTYVDSQDVSNDRISVLSDIFVNVLSGFVLLDHPEIFWVNGVLCRTEPDSSSEYTVIMQYSCDKSKIDIYNKDINNAVDRIVKEVPKGTEYEKALWVHDYIVNNTEYVLNPVWAVGTDKDLGGSIYGLFIKKEAVCEGYSKAFKYILDELGIPCTVITGTCNDGVLHAWNIIEIDGKYYQVDVTWDDPISESGPVLLHDYFCVSDSKIYESRKSDGFISAPICNSNI